MIVQILEEYMSYNDLTQWARLQSLAGYNSQIQVKGGVAKVFMESKDDVKLTLAKVDAPLEDGKTPEEKKKVIKATTVADDEGVQDIEVNVIGSHYIYSHGKKPAGSGTWAFGVGSREPKDMLFFDGVYSKVVKDATAVAKKKAKQSGKAAVKLYVMESNIKSYDCSTMLESEGKLHSGKVLINNKPTIATSGISESVVREKLDKMVDAYWLTQLEEKVLTKPQTRKKEAVAKGMMRSVKDLKARYGSDWKSVAHATATNIAKKVKLKESSEVIAEETQTFEIEYEIRSPDGNSKGTTKYKALNAQEARNRFIKDNQGKQVSVKSIKPVVGAVRESVGQTKLAMDVHDLAQIITKEAAKAGKERIAKKQDSSEDEFDKEVEMEDGFSDYIDLVIHHLEDNRAELTTPEKIKSYLSEDYAEPEAYGSSKDEVIANLIAKYFDSSDSEEIVAALEDAFKAGAELGGVDSASDDIGLDLDDTVGYDDLEDQVPPYSADVADLYSEPVKESDRSEYSASLSLQGDEPEELKTTTKEFDDFTEWKTFVKGQYPSVQFSEKLLKSGKIILAKSGNRVLGSYSIDNNFGFIGEDSIENLEAKFPINEAAILDYANFISEAKVKSLY